MSYEEKYGKALSELEKTGIWNSSYLPLSHKLAKSLGLKPRLPHYVAYLQNVLTQGLWFAAIWAVYIWFFSSNAKYETFLSVLETAGPGGLIVGSLMAFYFRFSAIKHRLSNWNDL